MKQTTTEENKMQVNGLTMYTIKYKKHAGARTIQTVERFGSSIEQVTETTEKALDEEYFGDAVIVSVTPTEEGEASASAEIIAESYGIAAFERGDSAIPALDSNLMDMIGHMQIGEGTDLLKAWAAGWTKANLAAPVE